MLWVGLGAPAVLPAPSVDNFWHNDLFAHIGSTCGGGEWRYLVDLHVILASHLASFLLLALWTVSKVFLFCRHLSWGNEETQIGKVKEERKTPFFKVLSYLDNTAQALLLRTPDRCHINPRKGTIA